MYVVHRCQLLPTWLVYAESIKHLGEFVSIFCVINALGCSAQNINACIIQACSEVVWYLTACRQYHSMRCLKVDNIHHPFVGQFVKIETVAHVIVGRNGFRIIVNHHRTPSFFSYCHQSIYATPVKFHRATDAICTRAEHYH